MCCWLQAGFGAARRLPYAEKASVFSGEPTHLQRAHSTQNVYSPARSIRSCTTTHHLHRVHKCFARAQDIEWANLFTQDVPCYPPPKAAEAPHQEGEQGQEQGAYPDFDGVVSAVQEEKQEGKQEEKQEDEEEKREQEQEQEQAPLELGAVELLEPADQAQDAADTGSAGGAIPVGNREID